MLFNFITFRTINLSLIIKDKYKNKLSNIDNIN